VLPDADSTIAEVEDQIRLSEERAARMPAFESALAEIRGAATSKARDVRAEVDVNGRVVSLELTEQALQVGARRLAREILTTIGAAESQAKLQAVKNVATLLGDDDPITLQLRADAEAHAAATAAPKKTPSTATSTRKARP
jgi:vacuolar-type H+-ATPase subunit E/Vma4